MGQIAYVGDDAQIYLSDLEAGTRQLVSDPDGATGDRQVLYNWPTWSPDGGHLAFFRFDVVGGEVRQSSVETVAADGRSHRDVYRGRGGSAPIYMAWAPDSRYLAILVQEENQLLLRVTNREGTLPPSNICQGAPLYFAWRPDSRGIVVHVGPEVRGGGPSRILWIDVETGGVAHVPLAQGADPGFRAPVWCRSLDAALFAAGAGNKVELLAQASSDSTAEPFVGAGGAPALVPSPKGSLLAYASQIAPDQPLYDGIWIYDFGHAAARRLTEEPLLALFWCPDGERIVWITGDQGNRTVRLCLTEVATGAQAEIGWLRPTRDVWLMLSHFDQYAQSASIISPSGEELILSASQAQERHNGSVPTVRRVLLRPIADPAQETVGAPGRLAFWRPEGAQPS